ncbi:MAG: hypothetical protein KIS79_12505 [Burkholderiales bacterium]|nr:hypothetical protein [Burkholderiales bacterium]
MESTSERTRPALNPEADDKDAADARPARRRRDAPNAPERGGGPSGRMPMPHERDESATENAHPEHKPAVQKEVIDQAQRDIDSGLEDTDCRGQPSLSPNCPAPAKAGSGARKEKP